MHRLTSSLFSMATKLVNWVMIENSLLSLIIKSFRFFFTIWNFKKYISLYHNSLTRHIFIQTSLKANKSNNRFIKFSVQMDLLFSFHNHARTEFKMYSSYIIWSTNTSCSMRSAANTPSVQSWIMARAVSWCRIYKKTQKYFRNNKAASYIWQFPKTVSCITSKSQNKTHFASCYVKVGSWHHRRNFSIVDNSFQGSLIRRKIKKRYFKIIRQDTRFNNIKLVYEMQMI